MISDRYYRFNEFGRELVYDVEGVAAFFLSDVESKLFDAIRDGGTIEEGVQTVQGLDRYDRQEILDGVKSLEDKGVWATFPAPYQEPSRTYALTLNVTGACNLRCRYCYIDDSAPATTMSGETARKAVDFLLTFEDLAKFGIAFYGGEPLLNFSVIRSTIEYASEKAAKMGLPVVEYHITTNGTLLTDEAIAFLKDYETNVLVSIDGPAPIHDAMRVTPAGGGTHARVSGRLKRLLCTEGNHKVSASGVITNRSRLKEAYTYLAQFDLRDIKLSYMRYVGESEYGLGEAEKEQYKADMRDLAQLCTALLLQGKRPPYYSFENKILHLWRGLKRECFCPAGVRRFGVSPSGDIYPCGPAAAMRAWKLGTLEDGLDESVAKEWAAIMSFEHRDACKMCWARHLCAGGCPLQLVRDLDDHGCEINRHATRLAIAIYATVKEQNEMMLAALVDEEILARLDVLVRRKLC